MNKYQQALNNCVNRWAPTADWNLLKSLVEKATPKKPDYWGDGIETDDGSTPFDHWDCPHCHHDLNYEEHIFCPNCGQAIDWSDE